MPQQFSKRKAVWLLAAIVLVITIAFGSLAALISTYTNDPRMEYGYFAFNNCGEIQEYLASSTQVYPYYYDDLIGRGAETDVAAPPTSSSGSPGDYSPTNVQVAGVDELDKVKTDGKYIYIAEGTAVFIRSVADISKDIAEISVIGTPLGIFVEADRLIIVSSDYINIDYETPTSSSSSSGVVNDIAPSMPYNPGATITVVSTYDISNISNPDSISYVIFDGQYHSARLHDGNVYLIANYAANVSVLNQYGVEKVLPHFMVADLDSYAKDGKPILDTEASPLLAECNEISRYGDLGSTFTNVVAFPVSDPTKVSAKVLLGSAQTIYMSQNNLLLTATRYQESNESVNCDFIEMTFGGCVNQTLRYDYSGAADTEVYRLSIEGTEVQFRGSARVPGTVLNQFSVDEHSGYFRLATTGNTTGGRWSQEVNNLYVLDENMQVVGKLEGLAPTERIYAVRYMGDRAYMVTYRQVDPFYVIDLSDPKNPSVLGELKIPGFSEYLHPYDENHIIVVGQEATTSGRVTGVKVALFDVTDPANPVEVAKAYLGGSGSSTAVSYDHKAFLFDREKGLMVIPVSVYESSDAERYYGTYDFVGFKVFDISAAAITERGEISAEIEPGEEIYYYMNNPRSFYVGDDLFTYADGVLKQSVLATLKLVKAVEL